MNKIFSLLGLCMKAGLLSAGEVAAEAAIKNGKAKLIIISEDASENTKKKFNNASEFYKVKIVVFGKKEELGKSLGKAERAVLAVCDSGFADKISLLLN